MKLVAGHNAFQMLLCARTHVSRRALFRADYAISSAYVPTLPLSTSQTNWFVTRAGGAIVHLLSDKDGYSRAFKCCEKAETGWRILVLVQRRSAEELLHVSMSNSNKNAMCEIKKKLISEALRGCWRCCGIVTTCKQCCLSKRWWCVVSDAISDSSWWLYWEGTG
jgi:hypothetical protein